MIRGLSCAACGVVAASIAAKGVNGLYPVGAAAIGTLVFLALAAVLARET